MDTSRSEQLNTPDNTKKLSDPQFDHLVNLLLNHEDSQAIMFLESKGIPNAKVVCHDTKNMLQAEQRSPNSDTGQYIRDQISHFKEQLFTENLELTNVPFLKILSSAMRMAQYQHGYRDIRTHEEEMNGLSVHGNEMALIIAFQNLIGNAIKYSPEDSLITITHEKQKENLIIKISNQTKIIPDNFDPFAISSRFHTEISGNGIGLASVKKTLEKHHGEITWNQERSEAGNRVCFTLSIPLGSNPNKEPTVTVIEDDETILRSIRLLLNHLGIEPIIIDAKNDSYDAKSIETTELTFIDYMTGIGFEIAKVLKQRRRDMHIVIMSGYLEDRTLIGVPYDLWLKKPFSLEEIIKIVEAYKKNHQDDSMRDSL